MEEITEASVRAALRKMLESKGLSQAEVERRLDLSAKYLSKLLRGQQTMKLSQVFDILRAAEESPREFFRRLVGDESSISEPPVAYDEEIYRQRREQFPDAPDELIRKLTRAEQDLDGATVRVTRALRQLELFRD